MNEISQEDRDLLVEMQPRMLDLYCALGNARYALELWEREYLAVNQGRPIPVHMAQWCIERGRRECETLREIEALIKPLACRENTATERMVECEEENTRTPSPDRAAILEEALRKIAEGNLGNEPWQANYERIQEVARAALNPTSEDRS